MLEQPSLLLKPWIHAFEGEMPVIRLAFGKDSPNAKRSQVSGPSWVRAIVNPVTNQTLGSAVWNNTSISRLFYYLGRRKIQVFESDDESLVMTLQRPWGLSRLWDVLDAEERLVGRLFRDAVYDGYDTLLATMAMNIDESEWQWRGEQGMILGTWQNIPGQGCYFHFEAPVDLNPFVRMAILAGVLALPPWPGDLSLSARPAL